MKPNNQGSRPIRYRMCPRKWNLCSVEKQAGATSHKEEDQTTTMPTKAAELPPYRTPSTRNVPTVARPLPGQSPGSIGEAKQRVIRVCHSVAHRFREENRLVRHDRRRLVPVNQGDALPNQDLPKYGKERAERRHAVPIHYRHQRHVVHLDERAEGRGKGGVVEARRLHTFHTWLRKTRR